MPAITSANVANAIVKLVAADALPALVGNLVMGNLVNRDYEASLAQAGDTINVPIPPTLTANNLAEGGTVHYRPTVHYAYHPCDGAVQSLHELAGKNWTMQANQRLIVNEVTKGIDELGVLLMGHPYRSWWTG